MHQRCLRSTICRYSDPLTVSFRRTRPSLSSLHSSFSGPNPSETKKRLHQCAVQHQETKPGPLDVNYNSIVNDASLAPTGNISQEILLGNEDGAETPAFTPGTFVEIRRCVIESYLSFSSSFLTLFSQYRNEGAIQGVVLGEFVNEQKILVYTLSAQGHVFNHYRADVHFAIPNLVSKSLAERCGMKDPTPTGAVARVEVLKRLQNLVARVDKQAAGMEKRPLNVYTEVMDPDPTKWTTTTVAHVTRLLYEPPTFMDYYMVHRYLIDQPLLYLANASYLQTQQFHVRPRRDIEEIQKVTEYIHRWRDGRKSPFTEFVRKARGVIERQKERRECGEIVQEKIEVTWSDEERIILNFLLRSLQSQRSNQSNPYETGRTELVRAILQPTTEVSDSLTFELAVQLGIIAPWQDLHELDPVLNPWGDFTFQKTLESEGTKILQSSLSKAKAGSVVGPMDFLPSDPLKSVRHDFGEARVYVIDDPAAEELDDGISLERIPNEPDNYWVHVHVADPTSWIHPNHILAKMARRQGSTYYLSQKSLPLLPKRLVHDPSFSLSLGGPATNKEIPCRVMVFSVKLDSNGNILDYKTQAGLIRNVQKTSYQQVELALGLPPPSIRYPLGGAGEPVPTPNFGQNEIEDLQILMKLAKDQISKRMREGIWQYGNTESRVRWNTRIPGNIGSPSLESSIYHGFPDLTFEVDDDSTVRGSRALVAEMMKLANRVASRVLLDHGVPVIRHALAHPITSPRGTEEILNARTPWGCVSGQVVIRNLEVSNAGEYCLEPKGHFILGVPEGEGYVRATSPLRRFEDMVTHWQLHHILLKSNSPRFSVNEIENILVEQEALSRFNKKVSKQASQNFSLLYLKQYTSEMAKGVERPFDDVFSSMDGWIRHKALSIITNKPVIKVNLPLLGIDATILDAPMSIEHAPLGGELRVKFDKIELGSKRSRMLVKIIE